MKNLVITDNEQIARTVVGIESDAKIMNLGNDKMINNMMVNLAKTRFNQEAEDYASRFDKHSEYLDKYKAKFKEEAKNLELMPLYRYILIKPFAENPFQQIKVESGIITDLGGQAPIYKSQETGEWEEEQSFIRVGLVIGAGPDVKFVKEGDVVMYPVNSEVPVPFYKQGFVTVDEIRVIVVINENLKARLCLN